ncbi:hypothetical protein LCGC14_3086460 [marine sediment metagenome]|uniref:Uncharacterized protein n=1 Tax=marine sediment metagenome TaxID=412755 RepID=A0A0F8WBM6_9ZZZZ|nr:hypothetical protein [Candidatus Scalindua sp.]
MKHWIKNFKLRNKREFKITNNRIIPGDMYVGTWSRGELIVIATHEIAKNDNCFSGTVISIDDDMEIPVGVHANHWPVNNFKWLEPRNEVSLRNR